MGGEKTEEPTDKHLRDAAEEGQVAKSQEIPAAAVVLRRTSRSPSRRR